MSAAVLKPTVPRWLCYYPRPSGAILPGGGYEGAADFCDRTGYWPTRRRPRVWTGARFRRALCDRFL